MKTKTQDSLRVISPGLAEFQASLRSHPWSPCNSPKGKGCTKHGEPPLLPSVWLGSATCTVHSEDSPQAKAAGMRHVGPCLGRAPAGSGLWICIWEGMVADLHKQLLWARWAEPAVLCTLPSRQDWGCGGEGKCLQHSASLGSVLVIRSACTS